MNLFKYTSSMVIGIFLLVNTLSAQSTADVVFNDKIQGVRFHMYGNQLSMPVYKLNGGDRLELHFDDMDANVKSYYYTYQLCDYNWDEVNLSQFDYIKGFTQMRISTYRFSSIAYTRYTHYQAILPETSSVPTRSGNYLLKVFLDGDVSKVAFTRRLLVLDSKSAIAAQIIQPFTTQNFRTDQRIRFSVNVEGLNTFSAAQQIKVVVLQNYRWDNAQGRVPPTFVRGNTLEYNTENNFVFQGGKEWRWLDLRSFRLQSDRVKNAVYKKDATEIFVQADADRAGQRYVYYPDLDGLYQVETYESINPYWQGDYATVHFSYVPPGRTPYPDKDVYLLGQLTDYKFNESTKLQFNSEEGAYQGTAFLKQGYYSYGYLLIDKNDPAIKTEIDGGYFETENTYTILVYYRSFTDQSDQLIGVAEINSRAGRPIFSF